MIYLPNKKSFQMGVRKWGVCARSSANQPNLEVHSSKVKLLEEIKKYPESPIPHSQLETWQPAGILGS